MWLRDPDSSNAAGEASPPREPSPTWHCLGARSARRERCPTTRSRTTRRELMKYRSSAASLALAVVAVLGLAGPAAAQHQVPFHGVFEGDYTVTPIPGTPTATLVVTASGHGSQVGA